MRKVKLFIASSLDCYIARSDGRVDWLFTDGDYGYAKFYDSIDTAIMGRKTYETALKFEEQPYKDKKCYVFTRSPGERYRNVEFSSDVVGVTRDLVSSEGKKDIWLVGGAEINSILLDAGLVHEIIVAVHPTILGSGIPMFNKVKQADMKLLDLVRYDNGLLQMRYELLLLSC
jgi:dihydrofolate reductase